MRYFVGTDKEGKIYCWSEVKSMDFMEMVETDYDISNETDKYTVDKGVVRYAFEVPSNPLVVYEMIPPCPVDKTITKRIIYWDGIVDSTTESFKIWLSVIHYQGEIRATELDAKIWTKADSGVIIDNPMNPGEIVDELVLFKTMLEFGVPLPSVVLYGIQCADLDGTLNKRIYANF